MSEKPNQRTNKRKKHLPKINYDTADHPLAQVLFILRDEQIFYNILVTWVHQALCAVKWREWLSYNLLLCFVFGRRRNIKSGNRNYTRRGLTVQHVPFMPALRHHFAQAVFTGLRPYEVKFVGQVARYIALKPKNFSGVRHIEYIGALNDMDSLVRGVSFRVRIFVVREMFELDFVKNHGTDGEFFVYIDIRHGEARRSFKISSELYKRDGDTEPKYYGFRACVGAVSKVEDSKPFMAMDALAVIPRGPNANVWLMESRYPGVTVDEIVTDIRCKKISFLEGDDIHFGYYPMSKEISSTNRKGYRWDVTCSACHGTIDCTNHHTSVHYRDPEENTHGYRMYWTLCKDCFTACVMGECEHLLLGFNTYLDVIRSWVDRGWEIRGYYPARRVVFVEW